MMTDEDCAESPDGTHCVCWWDDEGPCHFCADDTPPTASDTRDKNGNRFDNLREA